MIKQSYRLSLITTTYSKKEFVLYIFIDLVHLWEYMERLLVNSFPMKQCRKVKFASSICDAFYWFHMGQGNAAKTSFLFSMSDLGSKFYRFILIHIKQPHFYKVPTRSTGVNDHTRNYCTTAPYYNAISLYAAVLPSIYDVASATQHIPENFLRFATFSFRLKCQFLPP